MLRSQHRTSRFVQARGPVARHHRGLLVFSVGGQQVAARTEDIAGVCPWPETMPVPSDTPFVAALVRLEKDCMPVYDLAARLNRTIDPATALCLIVKHEDGPMAIRIDPSIPSLHMVDSASVHEQTGGDSDIAGICSIGEERLRIIHLARLGKGPLASMNRTNDTHV